VIENLDPNAELYLRARESCGRWLAEYVLDDFEIVYAAWGSSREQAIKNVNALRFGRNLRLSARDVVRAPRFDFEETLAGLHERDVCETIERLRFYTAKTFPMLSKEQNDSLYLLFWLLSDNDEKTIRSA
jgi:hypothetical protein